MIWYNKAYTHSEGRTHICYVNLDMSMCLFTGDTTAFGVNTHSSKNVHFDLFGLKKLFFGKLIPRKKYYSYNIPILFKINLFE